MKILHTVEFYSPSVGGAQEVVKQLSEHMVKLGHEVTVATTKISGRKSTNINGVKIKEFDVSGNEAAGYKGTDVEKYKNFLIKSKFDVIMNYAAQTWTTDIFLTLIHQINSRKIIVPCGFSGLHNPIYSDYYKKMKIYLSKYDVSVYMSSSYRDMEFAKKNNIENLEIIPNGADEREFNYIPKFDRESFLSKYKIPLKNNLILTIGTHTGNKGHAESISTFMKAKVKNSSLIIIGNIPSDVGCYLSCLKKAKINNLLNMLLSNGKSIHILNIDRDEILNFYKVADIFLFLSNIECSPLVLFECAASGLPYLTTDVGNSREITSWTKSGLVIKSVATNEGYVKTDLLEAANKLTELIKKPKLLSKYSKNGRSMWLRKFTWEKLTKRYLNLYKA